LGLFHSTDGGANFNRMGPEERTDNIGFGRPAPVNTYPALYMAATVNGVHGIYRSDDVGATWDRINDDDHQYAWAGSDAITGDPRIYGRVYLSTNGRGIIYGDINR
jgi:hypothetical protein